MKHPNALYRARMKPRCSRASLRAARLALAVPLLIATCNNAYSKAFAKQQATPAEVWSEWIGPRLVRLRKQQLLEIARVKLLPGHIFANTDGLISGGAFLPTGAK